LCESERTSKQARAKRKRKEKREEDKEKREEREGGSDRASERLRKIAGGARCESMKLPLTQ
jgi:hypothetical protein